MRVSDHARSSVTAAAGAPEASPPRPHEGSGGRARPHPTVCEVDAGGGGTQGPPCPELLWENAGFVTDATHFT